MQYSVISTKITCLSGSQPLSAVLDAKQQLMDRNNKTLWDPDVTCHFVLAKRRDLHQNVKFIWVPALICVFFMQNSDFMTRLTSLYGSQTSSVVFCMQNSMTSIRNTSLYVSQPSSVVFECKTAHFGPELQIFKGTRPHLSFCACNTV